MIEYFLIFILLALTAFGLPLPEESTLLLAAYFAASGSSVGVLLIACVLGIGFSDAVMYTRGRFKSKLFSQFKPGKKFINKTGFFAVFTSRFFISSRVVMPFMAGAMQMPKAKFHAASILSALFSSTIIILVGAWVYNLLPDAIAPVIWMVIIAVKTSILVMFATRSQVQLAKEN